MPEATCRNLTSQKILYADCRNINGTPFPQYSFAYAINDAVIVVGSSDTQGVVWRVVLDESGIDHVSDPVALPALAGATEWSAVDIGETVDGAPVAAGYTFAESIWESTVWLVELDPEDRPLVFSERAVGLGDDSFSLASNTFGDVCGTRSIDAPLPHSGDEGGELSSAGCEAS